MTPNIKKVQEYLEKRKRGGGPATWEPQNLLDYMAYAESLPAPTWLIKGFVRTGAAHLLSGPPTRGMKTWLAFAQAAVIASGKPMSIFEAPKDGPKKVLIIEAEGAIVDTMKRWTMLSRGKNEIQKEDLANIKWSHMEGFCLSDRTWAISVADYVEKNNIEFVIIDTFAMSFSGNENSVQDVTTAFRNLNLIRVRGASVLVLHHIGKPKDGYEPDPDDEIRGSSAIIGYFDVHQAARRKSLDTPYVNLSVSSNEFTANKKYIMHWKFEGTEEEKNEAATLQIEEKGRDEVGLMELENFFKMLPQDKRKRGVGSLKKLWKVSDKAAEEIIDNFVNDGRLVEVEDGYWRRA